MNEGNIRSEMLETARSLILRDPEHFSVAALCRETGLSRTKIRQHFPSKNALMTALLDGKPASPKKSPPQNSDRAATPVQTQAPVVPDKTAAMENPPPQTDSRKKISEPGWIEHRFDIFERALSLLEAKTEETAREQSRTLSLVEEKLSHPANAVPDLPPLVVVEPEAPSAPRAYTAADALVIPPIEFRAPPTSFDAREKLQTILVKTPEAKPAAAEPERLKKASLWMLAAAGLVFAVLAVSARMLFPDRPAALPRIPEASASIAQARAETASKIMVIDATGAASGPQSGAGIVIARAERGDARAQAQMAIAYLKGDGVEVDPAAAMRWSQTAAAKGDATAQFILGSLYTNGITPDPARAFKWYSAAAAGGNVKAMHNLAMAYLNGAGVDKNPAAAATWFAKAANGGYRDSALNLAVLYELGEGVLRSPSDALRWYDAAASLGDGEAAARARNLRTQLALVAGR